MADIGEPQRRIEVLPRTDPVLPRARFRPRPVPMGAMGRVTGRALSEQSLTYRRRDGSGETKASVSYTSDAAVPGRRST